MSTAEIGTTRTGVTELTRLWAVDHPWASLLIVHGLGEHSGRYERTGSLLADAGIETRAFDLVGFGASGGRRGDCESWNAWLLQILDNLAPGFNSGLPTVLLGHSLGGLIAASYALSLNRQPDLLVLSAPALGGGAGWQRALARVAGRVLPTAGAPSGVKGEHLSRDEAVGEAYFADPLVLTKSTVRLGATAFDQMDKVNRSLDALDATTLVFHGGLDTLVPPSASVPLEALPNVQRTVYPRLRHETMNEPEGPEVVADLIAWIRSKVES
jgi:alpha-beta hydrolase superfamily lysophospholipase